VKITKRKKMRLALEYVPRDMEKYIDSMHKRGGINHATIKWLMFQLLTGIGVCHANNILHRDLKPANLLISRRHRLKIADFGLAVSLARRRKALESYVATLWYMAPDNLLGNTRYNGSIDIWSIGSIMAELFTGEALFRGDSSEYQLDCIFQVMGTPTEATWPGLSDLPEYKHYSPDWETHSPQPLGERLPQIDPDGINLLSRTLQMRPEQRISAAEALAHPWFDAVRERGRRQW
jgi:serine/threonine protein kinase